MSAGHGWLDGLGRFGPFLTLPVAERVWPAGMPALPPHQRAALRHAVAEVLAAKDGARSALTSTLLDDVLGWGAGLRTGTDMPAALAEPAPHGGLVRPDFAFWAEVDDDAEPEVEDGQEPDEEDETAVPLPAASAPTSPWRLLGLWTPPRTHPLTRTRTGDWVASPVERLAHLLRARDVPIGLVSDGRWWALVWAPRGQAVGAAVWDAETWGEDGGEPLRAFVALLHRRRFLGVSDGSSGAPDDRLPALLAESARAQEEVTVTLGAQVREAVQLLVARFDELDRASGGRLLHEVSDDDAYAGIVTVMMRVVFLLFAEERQLLPADDARYASSYSVGQLADQLQQRARQGGEQTLEHRTGAWLRLMALSRALHRGVAHADLRLPAYGGGLFDPDRYPWLEGWDGASPGVDDLTVLRVLEAVQFVLLRGERRRLTFRSLDVEQIGYVYEGLLDLEVRTAQEPVLGLSRRGKKGLTLLTLTEAREAVAALEAWTATTYVGEKKLTPARRSSAARWLAIEAPPTVMVGLQQVLGVDVARELQPLAVLVRSDERRRPVVTPAGGRYVAPSSRRAAAGAHYTPRALAETVVRHALDPLVFDPGPLETLDETQWRLRPSTDLLALRVADIAMGSGAFLVAACRWLADRLVEAWVEEGDAEARRELDRRTTGAADAEVTPVVLRARRAVADRCLYGVDINPLAVEMAKLSLWLVTMDRERPFGFLDDRLVPGDSLLGLTSLAQLETLHLDPVEGRRIRPGFDLTAAWRRRLHAAADERRRITARPTTEINDYDVKAALLQAAVTQTEPLREVADAIVGAGLRAAGLAKGKRNDPFVRIEQGVWAWEAGQEGALTRERELVQAGLPEGKQARDPLHWPLAFPEVFADASNPGFDAIVGNPPFMGGQDISGHSGVDYGKALQVWDGAGVKGSCDLAARFLLRADLLLKPSGQTGFVTTKTVIEGSTLKAGLAQLLARRAYLRRGTTPHPWPAASANVSVLEVWTTKHRPNSFAVLDGEAVPNVGPDLQPFLREIGRPDRLPGNEDLVFQGSNILGLGFTLTAEERDELWRADPASDEVVFPYVIGADLNRRPDTSASRWVIDFRGRALEQAERYAGAMERVRRLVKPIRDLNKRPARRDRWWSFAERASELYAAIADLDHVLAISLVGNTLLPVRVPTGQVFAHACAVFAMPGFDDLALLSSSFHQCWAIRYTSTMRSDIRYAPSDIFLTLPRPAGTPEMTVLGEALDTERRKVMLGRALGLTKLYNQVHDPRVDDPAIRRLREIHADLDAAVADAYGWSDLDLAIGHHRTKIGTRWTVSPLARFEMLDRLLVENHRRAGTHQDAPSGRARCSITAVRVRSS